MEFAVWWVLLILTVQPELRLTKIKRVSIKRMIIVSSERASRGRICHKQSCPVEVFFCNADAPEWFELGRN